MNREGLYIIGGNLVLLTVGTLLIFTLLPQTQAQPSISQGEGDIGGSPLQPLPIPQSDDEPSKQDISFGKLHGVNFIDPLLNRKEGSPLLPVQTDFIDEFVSKARESNFNVFRIPVRWEAYVDNKDIFLAELVYLVKTSNENKIFVWIDFHHFDATSNWGHKVSNGNGFPEFVVSCYKPEKGYERDPEVRAFWNDYYLNKVRDSENSCKRTLDVWHLQAEFMKAMINKIDDYPNVLGYELINEPHLWEDAQYEYLGDMSTAISKELRTATDKILFFTRETAHGLEPDDTKYTRKIGLEYKILPRDPIKNVMYVPHLYDLEEIENHVSFWKELQRKWSSMGYDVNIGVGEWSPQPPQIVSPSVTRQNIEGFVSAWAQEGWMHTYWAFGGFNFGEGNVLIKPTGELSSAGKHYRSTIIDFYDTKAGAPDVWETAYALGKFPNSDPPVPDQIFKFQYGVSNGTIHSFDIQQERNDVFLFHTIVANVSSTDGVFEIKYPRNFPYTNDIGGIDKFVFIVEHEDGSIEERRTNTDCFFIFSVHFTGDIKIKMSTPSIVIKSARHGDNIQNSCIPQTLVENVHTMKDGIISPLHQSRAGVTSEDTVCPETRQGEQLMLLISPHGKPFCVKISDEEFMKKRGWTEHHQN